MMTDCILENIVASAATNGVIITWDLNKPGRNKQGQPVCTFLCKFIGPQFSRAVATIDLPNILSPARVNVSRTSVDTRFV